MNTGRRKISILRKGLSLFNRYLFFSLFLVVPNLQAQQPSLWHNNGPLVTSPSSVPLQNAFAGGLNSPQFSQVDLDNDGLNDLVIFDRATGKVSCFKASGTAGNISYLRKHQWEYAFPKIFNYMFLRDYDCDGKPDIFTSVPLGLTVYRNTSVGDELRFTQVVDFLETTTFSGNPVNLQVQGGDLPHIGDIDGDGDLDVFTLVFAGASMEFHKNVSREQGLGCGLKFEKVTGCWGGYFTGATCGAFSFGQCREGIIEERDSATAPMHLGATNLLFDINGDGAVDLLTGDVGCSDLYALVNQGSTSAPSFTSVLQDFPNANDPARFLSFLAAFDIDIDQNGKRDLLVSNNLVFNESLLSDFSNSVWYYKNISNTQVPNFQLQQRNFLQDGMIDFGDESSPLLVDVDGDGRLDLLVGNGGQRRGSRTFSSLAYLRNTGTNTVPSFQLITTDYLNLSTLNRLNLTPYVLDYNNDGRLDLLLFSTNGNQSLAEIYVYLNNNPSGQPWNLELQNPIVVRGGFFPYDSHAFIDINGDGLVDMLVGDYFGRVRYYQNTGSVSAPNWVQQSTTFAGIEDRFRGITKICITDLNGDSQPDLLTGDDLGGIRFYSNIRQGALQPITPDTLLLKEQDGFRYRGNFGKYIQPTAGDLTGDGLPEIITGSMGGGLFYFENSTNYITNLSETLSNVTALQVYPNPARLEDVTLKTESENEIEISDLNGRVITTIKPANELNIKLIRYIKYLPAGMYFAKVKDSHRQIQNSKPAKFLIY